MMAKLDRDDASENENEDESENGLNPAPLPAFAGSGVTRDEVRHVAALASLQLTDEEEERMQRDLSAILGYIGELNELDTSHVEPLSQISELLPHAGVPGSGGPDGASTEQETLRADEPRVSLPRLTVMAQAPATDGTFFKVPKVIER